jgi:hypothetical protein
MFWLLYPGVGAGDYLIFTHGKTHRRYGQDNPDREQIRKILYFDLL